MAGGALLLLLLLLLLGALKGNLMQEIRVSQPPVIWAAVGDDVTLPCHYNISEEMTIGSYRWTRHLPRIGPEITENNENFSGRLSKVSTDQFIRGHSADIILHHTEESDSGLYYCEVSFQARGQVTGYGNGTFLNVTCSSSSPGSSLGVICGGVAGGLLLVAVVGFLCWRCLSQATTTRNRSPITYRLSMEYDPREREYQMPEELQDSSQYCRENLQYSHFQEQPY